MSAQANSRPERGNDPRLEVDTVAEAYLALLRSRGIDRLYLNAGTDFAPLVEAYGRLHAIGCGDRLPRPVMAAHENLAVGMAHGAYLMTGRPQAVMFHVSVGTANAVCAVMNAARDQVPLLVTAGRTPLFESGPRGARDTRIHWAQEMFDQASLLRELVKWDYELRDAGQVETVVERALTIAASEPKGPVYLSLPREVLARPAGADGTVERKRAPAIPTPPRADPAAVARLADQLAAAHLPVIVASGSGVEPRTVAALASLCDHCGIGYAEEQARCVNLPADHPLHLGFQVAPLLAEADVVCVIECDVPWMPTAAAPRDDAFVAQCGVDPAYESYPIRSHRSDLSITANAISLIADLADALRMRASRIDPERRGRLAARAALLRTQRDAERAAVLAQAEGLISREFLSATLGEVLTPETVLFNEYWMTPADAARTEPRSYFYLPPAGGLGWALPAALGAKQAAPARTVVAAMGDGAYLFANPAACHHASARHDLPVLTVVFNNARWGAVDNATQKVFPGGRWTEQGAPSLSDLTPVPALERYVEASGGYGECVAKRADLLPALRRALLEVQANHRQAVLNVIGK